MDAPFAYSRGAAVQYAMQGSDGSAVFTRGVPVLRWAGEKIRADKELVQFLVWSNPSNLHDASPALQADPDIVSTALQSPYYWEENPKTSAALVLRNAAEELRDQRTLVLDAVALNGWELEFVGDTLRADPYVVAWAGAPKGAGANMRCGKEIVRFMNTLPQSGVTVNPIAHYSSPPGTRHRRTYTLLRRPWLLAVSGKVTQFATPVTRHAVTQHMKCAPHRGRISGIISRQQLIHSGPRSDVAGIRGRKHRYDPARCGRALRRILQDLEETAPCGRIKPLDIVRFRRSELGNDTL
jgi:hypothetical protein